MKKKLAARDGSRKASGEADEWWASLSAEERKSLRLAAGSSLDGEAHRQAKKERDHQRKGHRVRKRLPRGLELEDGYLKLKNPPPSQPLSEEEWAQRTADYWAEPTDAHWVMLDAIRFLVERAGERLDLKAMGMEGLEYLRPHEGKIPRDMIEWVRAAYVAAHGWPAEVVWELELAHAMAEALAVRLGAKPQQLDPSGPPGASGFQLLRWLQRRCPRGTVPAALTREAIDAALERATLGRGGGTGPQAKQNLKTVWAELVRSVTGREPHAANPWSFRRDYFATTGDELELRERLWPHSGDSGD